MQVLVILKNRCSCETKA